MKSSSERAVPQTADPLGEALYSLRLNGVVYANSELSAPWGLAMPAMPGNLMFHIVTQGACWLRVDDQKPLSLNAGDLVLLPKGQGHEIASGEAIRCEPFFDIPVTRISERFEFMSYGGGGEQTKLTCGVVSFDHHAGEKLVAHLPQVIQVRGQDGALPSSIQALLNLMSHEARYAALGGDTVISHLADIIVIHAIRYWIESSPQANEGWLGALQDPKLGRALGLIHSRPESAWTVDTLAKEAGMSRSGFSSRFTELVGVSVKQYLTEWRMGLARMKLLQSPVSLTELAEELGYQSEAAFSRAYKRIMGTPPIRPGKVELSSQPHSN